MANPTAAMLVIGDEILSGRTRDSNLHHLAGRLTEAGIDLREARVVRDDEAAIVGAVVALSETYDHVFTSGGIGPTHDDITADAVARAFEVGIGLRDDARSILEAHYASRGQALTEARLRMARIPDGARLIENPVTAAPGFTLGNVNVMAGVPRIFEAMLENVLRPISGGTPTTSETLRVERGEGDIAAGLRAVAEANADVTVGSYPFDENGVHGSNVVVRGADPARVRAVAAELREVLGVGD